MALLGVVTMGGAPPLEARPLPWPAFERLTNEEGLSQTSVVALAQDAQGFVWVGTETGVERFDGYSVETYPIEHTGVVRSIWPAADGTLWLGHLAGGLVHLDPVSSEVTYHVHDPDDPHSLPSDRVRVVIGEEGNGAEGQGGLWIGTTAGLAHLPAEALAAREGVEPGRDDGGGPGLRFQVWRRDGEASEEARKDYVYDLAADGQGGLWIGTEGDLAHFDPRTRTFRSWQHDPDDPHSLPPGPVRTILVDRQGRLWLGVGDRLVHFDDQGGETRQVIAMAPPASQGQAEANGAGGDRPLRSDPRGPSSLIFSRIQVWDLAEDDEGRIWMALGPGGAGRFDPGSGEMRFLPREQGQDVDATPTGLPGGVSVTVMRDRAGLIWCGVAPGGVFYFQPSDRAIERVRASSADPLAPSSGVVLDLLELPSGELWVGSQNGGLERRDPESGRFEQFRADEQGAAATEGRLSANGVSALVRTADGRLAIGTQGGLDFFDPTSRTFQSLHHDPEDPRSLPADNVEALALDTRGRLWVGTTEGLARLEADGGFTRFPPDPDDPRGVGHRQVMALEVDGRGGLWVGTWGGGADYWDPRTETFRRHRHDPEDPRSLGNNAVRTLWVDGQDRAWVGTDGAGITVLDPLTGPVRHWREADGLVDDVVQCILGDAQGRFWIATNQGISVFDPRSGAWSSFDQRDGLQDLEFDHDACSVGASGRLFFGGIRGYNAIRAEHFRPQPAPPVVFTHLRVGDRAPRVGVAASSVRRLELGAEDRSLTFEISALGFLRMDKNRYAYRLEGFDEDWQEAGSLHFGRYTNLPAGEYVLRARGSNSHGVWGSEGAAVELVVHPPWWRTSWAFGLWLVLGVGAILGHSRHQAAKIRREREINAQLRDVDRFKDQFLASTSHELRTPLYGITGLAESLLEHPAEPLGQETRSDLGLIVASGRRLSALVDDILDIARLQRGGLDLRLGVVDLYTLADVVTTLSWPLVGGKPVELVNRVPTDLPSAWADENRLQQILHNLLGNAVKFTPRGRVELSATFEPAPRDPGMDDSGMEGGRLVVAVSDTGVGIAEAEQAKIFGAFEQSGSPGARIQGGIGLGLAISRELVEMHGGELWLESEPGEGSTFYFSLPAATEAQIEAAEITSEIPMGLAEEVAAEVLSVEALEPPSNEVELPVGDRATMPSDAESAMPSVDGSARPRSNIPAPTVPLTSSLELREVGRPRLLVVDDEAIIRRVLASQLIASGYEVHAVKDGPEALEATEAAKYDLVLLDVMMPGMSGYEVCRRLRARFGPTELPILLLTAKSRVGDRVTGLEHGANDFLAKPVALDELRARVHTHLGLLAAHRAMESRLEQKAEEAELLGRLVPICAQCKKIRSDQGFWDEVEIFVESEYGARFSHGICPTCFEAALAELRRSKEPG